MMPGHDLEADGPETAGDLVGVDAGVPDVADREGGHEGEGLRPVHPRVPADRGVAVGAASPTGAHGRSACISRRYYATFLSTSMYLDVWSCRVRNDRYSDICNILNGAIEEI